MNEILSLESYIERTEDRLLATKWTPDLLDPLEAQGEELAEANLTTSLTALQQAKAKFDVNGRIGARIDEILDKYSSLLPDPVEEMEAHQEDVVLSVDAEADNNAFPEMADSLFEEKEDHIWAAKDRPADADAGEIDIFAHKISLEDVQAAMDLSLQKDDLAQLRQRLRAKLGDKVVASLRKSKLAEKQFVLIPRIPRVRPQGSQSTMHGSDAGQGLSALFGKIQELDRYRGSGGMTPETPEPGWALISLESPRESMRQEFHGAESVPSIPGNQPWHPISYDPTPYTRRGRVRPSCL